MTVILVSILSAGIKQSINLITININEDNHIIIILLLQFLPRHLEGFLA